MRQKSVDPLFPFSLSLSSPSYSELGRWKRKSSCFGLLGRLAVAVRKKRTSLITSTFYFTSAAQVISSAVLSCSKKDRAKRRLRYCNRLCRPLMKLRQIQNLPSAVAVPHYMGTEKCRRARTPKPTNARNGIPSAIVCQLSFRIRRSLGEREKSWTD